MTVGNTIRRERMYPWRMTYRFSERQVEATPGGYPAVLRRVHRNIRRMAMSDGAAPGSLRIAVMRDPDGPSVFLVIARWTLRRE